MSRFSSVLNSRFHHTNVLVCVLCVQVDKVLGKDFAEKYTGLKNSATLLLATLSVKAHSGTVNKFMELATTILPAVKLV